MLEHLPKQETYLITSIFDSGLADFDRNIAFLNIESLESLFDIDYSERSLEIFLNKPLDIDTMQNQKYKKYLTKKLSILGLI